MSYVSHSDSGRGRAFDSVFTTQAKEQQNTSRVTGFYDPLNSSVYNAHLHPQNTQPNSGVCNANFFTPNTQFNPGVCNAPLHPQNTQFNSGVCNAPFCRSSRPGPSVFASSDESAMYAKRDCDSDDLSKVFASQQSCAYSPSINKFHRGFTGDTRPTFGSPNRLLASRLGGCPDKNESLLNAYDRARQFRSPAGSYAGVPFHVDDQSLTYRYDQAGAP